MKKQKIISVSLAVALTVSLIAGVAGFSFNCADVRNNVIRLHILANSDSPTDQDIKIKVRDVLLALGCEVFSGKLQTDEVEQCLIVEKDKLIAAADAVLSANGLNYKSNIIFTEEYFETRSYGDYTVPAGRYRAIKVILGEGKGKNWWCVMFPPLCLPAASENTDIEAFLDNGSIKVIESNPKYEVRFKIVEIYEKVKNMIKY